MFRITIVLFVIWIASSLSALAQETGGLRGTISDQSGALVPGAQIRVTSESGVAREVISTGDGSYTMNGLAPGKYTVRVSSAGLSQPEASTVDITGAVATLNISLRLVLEKQEVTVQEQLGGQVDTDPAIVWTLFPTTRTICWQICRLLRDPRLGRPEASSILTGSRPEMRFSPARVPFAKFG